jgi:hypothetical protein
MLSQQAPARPARPAQVNASPSLTASDKTDWVLKTAMLEVTACACDALCCNAMWCVVIP